MPRKCCICATKCDWKTTKFHELPSDSALRIKWLAVIPNTDSLGENPVVCNRHFQPTDYEPNLKVRKLKRGIVPMVVPHEEMDFEPYKEDGQKERYLEFFQTQIKEKNSELQNAKAKLQQIEMCIKTVSMNGGSLEQQLDSVLSQLKLFKEENRKKAITIESLQSEVKELKGTCHTQEHLQSVRSQLKLFKEENRKKAITIQSLQSEVKELKGTCHTQEAAIKTKDKLIQEWSQRVRNLDSVVKVPKTLNGPCQEVILKSNIKTLVQVVGRKLDLVNLAKERHFKIARMKVKNAKERRIYLEKIRLMRKQLDILLSERRELEQNVYYKNLENLILNMDADQKAAFLLDQIKLYNKKVSRYSDVTLQECIIWEDTDPKGYRFVRDSELLTLPAQWTMKKHLGLMNPEQEDSVHVNNSGTNPVLDSARKNDKSESSTIKAINSCLNKSEKNFKVLQQLGEVKLVSGCNRSNDQAEESET